GATGLLDRFPRRSWLRWAILGLFALVAAVLAAPSLGVNVGGTIAASSGLAATALLLWRGRLTWRAVALAGVVAALVLAAAAAADLVLHGDRPTHWGQAALMIVGGDWAGLGAIALRKVQLNLRLLRWTIWAQVLVVSLGLTA